MFSLFSLIGKFFMKEEPSALVEKQLYATSPFSRFELVYGNMSMGTNSAAWADSPFFLPRFRSNYTAATVILIVKLLSYVFQKKKVAWTAAAAAAWATWCCRRRRSFMSYTLPSLLCYVCVWCGLGRRRGHSSGGRGGVCHQEDVPRVLAAVHSQIVWGPVLLYCNTADLILIDVGLYVVHITYTIRQTITLIQAYFIIGRYLTGPSSCCCKA